MDFLIDELWTGSKVKIIISAISCEQKLHIIGPFVKEIHWSSVDSLTKNQ